MPSNLLSDKELFTLVEQFNLGSVSSLEQLNSDPSSLVFKAEGNTGKWLIKGHRQDKTPGKTEAEHTLLSALQQAGFKYAPDMRQCKTGRAGLQVANRLWSVYSLVENDSSFEWTHPNWSAAHCQAAAAGLAQLHCCGLNALDKPNGLRSLLADSVSKSIPAWFISAATTALQTPFAKDIPSLSRLEQRLDELKIDLLRVVAELEQGSDGSVITVVHGDFHPGNALFKGSELKAIIDFDFAHLDHPLYDLGYAAVMFCGNWGEDGAVLQENQLQALLSGYTSGLEQCGPQSSHAAVLQTAVQSGYLLDRYMSLSLYLLLLWALEGLGQASGDQQLYSKVIEQVLSWQRRLVVL